MFTALKLEKKWFTLTSQCQHVNQALSELGALLAIYSVSSRKA